MKTHFLSTLLVALGLAEELKTLDEVYGKVPVVEQMKPRRVLPTRRIGSDLYRATRLPEHCIFPLDIVLVQDATDSFTDDYVQMATVQLPLMTSILNETHPGSKFGVLSFQDKPIPPFGIAATPSNGYYADYCAYIDSPLTANYTAIQEIYASRKPNGGGDPPENQFHALLGATQASRIQWTDAAERARLIVVVTDAPPHFANDGSDPQGMRASTGTFNEANIGQQCIQEFYPSPAQVKASIEARATYVAFVVYDPEYLNGLVGKSWQWFNRYLGQTDSFITLQARDSSDFWVKLASIIGVIEEVECLPATPAPVTPPAENTVTPVGTPQNTTPLPAATEGTLSTLCPPCPPCPEPPCHCVCPPPPCTPSECPTMTKLCHDGVMIKLGESVPDLKVVVDGKEW